MTALEANPTSIFFGFNMFSFLSRSVFASFDPLALAHQCLESVLQTFSHEHSHRFLGLVFLKIRFQRLCLSDEELKFCREQWVVGALLCRSFGFQVFCFLVVSAFPSRTCQVYVPSSRLVAQRRSGSWLLPVIWTESSARAGAS